MSTESANIKDILDTIGHNPDIPALAVLEKILDVNEDIELGKIQSYLMDQIYQTDV